MTGSLALLQADAALAAQIERIAWAQLVMAVAMALIVLMVLGAAFGAWRAARAAQRLMADLQKIAERLSIRAEPLIDSGRRVADDASRVSRRVRRQVDELADTLEELNRNLREGAAEATLRVREFGAVLDVVQEEAEQLLMGGAATARGMHTTAAALRGERPSRRLVDAAPPAAPPPAPPAPAAPETEA